MARFEILWLTLCQLHNEFVIEVSTTALSQTPPVYPLMMSPLTPCHVMKFSVLYSLLEYKCIDFNLFGSLQFLPIYTPSEEEKRNPALFAINVRRVMAK